MDRLNKYLKYDYYQFRLTEKKTIFLINIFHINFLNNSYLILEIAKKKKTNFVSAFYH